MTSILLFDQYLFGSNMAPVSSGIDRITLALRKCFTRGEPRTPKRSYLRIKNYLSRTNCELDPGKYSK